jgi:AcrR family transcriptional regulator
VRKWTRRADARPEELAQAALDLCAERGVQATRVADVAARAGVTVGTVYRYFRDKEALVEAALARAGRPSARPTSVADRPGSTLPTLVDALRRWSAHLRGDGARAVRVSLSDPRRGAKGQFGVLGDAVAELEKILSDGAARGDIRDDLPPGAVAHALVSALAFDAVIGGSAMTRTDETLDALAALITRGLRADGPSWRPTGGI